MPNSCSHEPSHSFTARKREHEKLKNEEKGSTRQRSREGEHQAAEEVALDFFEGENVDAALDFDSAKGDAPLITDPTALDKDNCGTLSSIW